MVGREAAGDQREQQAQNAFAADMFLHARHKLGNFDKEYMAGISEVYLSCWPALISMPHRVAGPLRLSSGPRDASFEVGRNSLL
jgi:hypothetical protein